MRRPRRVGDAVCLTGAALAEVEAPIREAREALDAVLCPTAEAAARVEKEDLVPKLAWVKPLADKAAAEGKPGPCAYLLRNVFSPEECRSIVALCEKVGFEEALVNVGGGRQKLLTDIRNNTRVMIDDVPLADEIFDRIRAHLPATWAEGDPREWSRTNTYHMQHLNERLRVLRYYPGQEFKPHQDGTYVRGRMACALRGAEHEGDTSYVTVQMYLNGGDDGTKLRGGSTRFIPMFGDADDDACVDVFPEPGMCLVFEHRLLHQGSPVEGGVKYSLRTDVMYGTTKPADADEAAAVDTDAGTNAGVGTGAGAGTEADAEAGAGAAAAGAER